MPYESWYKEFYPTDADSDEASKSPISHSLRKWIGLRKENLSRHDVHLDFHAIKSEDGHTCLSIDADSCALCAVYYETKSRVGKCVECPLYQIRGASCDTIYGEDWDEDTPESPYHRLVNDGDPEPMIKLLERALELSKE